MGNVSRAGQDDWLFHGLDALEQQLVTHCTLPMAAFAETDNLSATAFAISFPYMIKAIGLAARQVAAAMASLTAALRQSQRGPTIGRKRRRRRARGRARAQR